MATSCRGQIGAATQVGGRFTASSNLLQAGGNRIEAGWQYPQYVHDAAALNRWMRERALTVKGDRKEESGRPIPSFARRRGKRLWRRLYSAKPDLQLMRLLQSKAININNGSLEMHRL
jgi:hypothetical protein